MNKKRFAAIAATILVFFGILFGQGAVQKVRLWDTNLSHSLLLNWNENRASAYTMNWIGITADRTITLQGNPTLDDWFNQSVKTTFSPTFTGAYLQSASAAPFLKLTNESDTERDPIIQFAVGATPVVKWTMGLDDSDVDKWKLTVGAEFGNHHDVIAISSGEGATPPEAEFTLIDSFVATSPRGICEDGIYLYYSDSTANQQLVKVDINTGAEITRSPDIGDDLYQCATDGTYVYVACLSTSNIQKYLCSDLSYDSGSVVWDGNPMAVCYWSGYLYAVNQNTLDIRKIRCSDMATIWTTEFGLGGGVNEMARPVSLAVDGQYIYVQDCAYGNNRIVRLNMDGTWIDSVVAANSMSYESIALWCAGDYLYNTAWYTSEYKIEKRNKSDLSISATFSMVPTHVDQGCQHNDYHYVVYSGSNFIYKYQYVSSSAPGTAGIQFRLPDVYGIFNDIAKLTAAGRFGVGTTIPSETIEAVGNIKAQAGQFISTKATGTAPIVVSSTFVCTNLNAGLVDGFHHNQSLLTTTAPLFNHLHLSATSNQIVLQSAGVTGTITATPASSNKIWTLQDVTGTIYQTGGTDVAVADGGTNKSTWTLYAIPYASGTTTIGEIAIGTAGQVLAVNGGANGYTWVAAGGALALDDLTDVDAITGLSDQDVLTWDAGTSKWIAAAGGGGTDHFVDLLDVPATYAGAGGYVVKVKGDASGLEFVAGGAGVSSFNDLDDVPVSYVGQEGLFVRVNATANGLEYAAGGGGGAPTDAEYVVETANGSLSAEVVLGTTVITTDALASRQAAAKSGRIFFPNNSFYVQRDTGAAWTSWGPIWKMIPPIAGDFAWVNQGTATSDSTYGGLSILALAAGGDSLKILKKAAPATPYKITACLLVNAFNVPYSAVGICFRQSSNGKVVTWAKDLVTPNRLAIMNWNSATSWNGLVDGLSPDYVLHPLWLRIADNGTNRVCSFSADGYYWYQFHTIGRTDFLTANEVGFYANSNNATYPVRVTLISWEET